MAFVYRSENNERAPINKKSELPGPGYYAVTVQRELKYSIQFHIRAKGSFNSSSQRDMNESFNYAPGKVE